MANRARDLPLRCDGTLSKTTVIHQASRPSKASTVFPTQSHTPRLDISGIATFFHQAAKYQESLEDFIHLLNVSSHFFQRRYTGTNTVVGDFLIGLKIHTNALSVKAQSWMRELPPVPQIDAFSSERKRDRRLMKHWDERHARAKRQMVLGDSRQVERNEPLFPLVVPSLPADDRYRTFMARRGHISC